MEKINSSSIKFDDSQLQDLILCLYQCARKSKYRATLVMAGNKNDYLLIVKDFIDKIENSTVAYISNNINDALAPDKIRTQLGRENDFIVFDAHNEFDIDAFAAITGTLRGGGLLFLLLPDMDNWPQLQSSRFMMRAFYLMRNTKSIYFVEKSCPLPEALNSVSSLDNIVDIEEPFRTIDQQHAVNEIVKNCSSGSGVPVVLVSDRGRGKSSSLGLAAGLMLKQGLKKIIITAPRLSISEPVFLHAHRIISQAEVTRNQLNWRGGWIKFIAPDALINEQPDADVVLVDEAAAIPVSLLEEFLKIYSSIVFATTVHGYEGTGRGFSLKFNKLLDQCSPGWQQLYMTTPVRWSEGDPLEQWVDRVLCLDADICDMQEIETIKPEKCEIKLLDRDTLINDEAKLSSLFALLVYAHYRTQPSDFRYLLDSPDVRVYSLEYNQSIIAVALINQEGGFDVDLSTEIYKGSRRPKGNLLAQTLTFHAGCEIAATFNYARIMRIAVHPEIQLRGLGAYFLGRVIEHEQDKVDAIGVSFGATVELIRFWKKSGFEIVRMGFTRDHVSATHSSVMLKPVTKNGEKVFNNVRDKFQRYLPAWLVEPLSGCSSEIKDLLNDEIINDDGKLSEDDWKEINSFIKTNRGYETCMWPIIKLVNNYRYKLSNLDEISQNVIQTKILNAMNWKETVKICHLSGKTEGVMKLRNAIERMMD